MPQIVEIDGVGEVEFPDSMSDADISDRIKNQIIPKYRAPRPADSVPVIAPTEDPNIPEGPSSNKAADFGRRVLSGVQSGIGRTVTGFIRAVDIAQDVAPVQTFSGFGGVGLPVQPAIQRVNTQIAQDQAERSNTRQSRLEESLPFQLGRVIEKEAPDTFGVDPERDDEFMAKLATAAGEMFPTLAAGIVAGPAAVMAQYGAVAGESQAQEAIDAGRPDVADKAFLNAAALGGLSEALIGVPGKFWAIVKGARKAGVKPSMFQKWINKNPVKGGIAHAGAEGSIRESVQEGVEQVGDNLIASDIAGYEPGRKPLAGAGEAAAIGGILGGVIGGGGAGTYQTHRNLTAQALKDTREGPFFLRKVSMLPEIEGPSVQPYFKPGPRPGYVADTFMPTVKFSPAMTEVLEALNRGGSIVVGQVKFSPATTEVLEETLAEFTTDQNPIPKAPLVEGTPLVEGDALTTNALPEAAQGAIQAANKSDMPGVSESKWTKKRVPIASLRPANETLWSGKFQPRGSKTQGPIVLSVGGEIIDGNNRVYEALQRGDTEIDAFIEDNPNRDRDGWVQSLYRTNKAASELRQAAIDQGIDISKSDLDWHSPDKDGEAWSESFDRDLGRWAKAAADAPQPLAQRQRYWTGIKRGLLEMDGGGTLRLKASDVMEGKFDVWLEKDGKRTMLSDPDYPRGMQDAQNFAVAHAIKLASKIPKPQPKAPNEITEPSSTVPSPVDDVIISPAGVKPPPRVNNASAIPTAEEGARWDALSAYQKPIVESLSGESLDQLANASGVKRHGLSDSALKEKIVNNTHTDDLQDAIDSLPKSETPKSTPKAKGEPKQRRASKPTTTVPDIIQNHIDNDGRKISITAARKLISDFKPTSARLRKLFSADKSAIEPDEAVPKYGAYSNLTDEEYLQALLDAEQVSSGSKKVKSEEAKAIDQEAEIREDFETELLTPNESGVSTSDLYEGSEFELDGEKMRVKSLHFDDESGDLAYVVIEDGRRFGTQRVGSDRMIFPDKGTFKENAPDTEFAPEDPFGFEPAESVEEQKVRLAAEKAKTDEQARKNKLDALAKKPLKGTTGDLGQGDLLAGPADLWAPPTPKLGSANKLVSADRAEELIILIKDKLGRVSSGIDPTLLANLTELGVFYLEGGIRSFPAWSKAMIEQFGPQVRPWLRSVYERIQDIAKANEAAKPKGGKWTGATGESGFVLDPAEAIKEIKRKLKKVGGYLRAAAGDVIDLASDIKQEQFKIGTPGDYRLAKLHWTGRMQRSWQEAHDAQRDIRAIFKDPVRDEAAHAWIEAAGDPATLNDWARRSTDPKRKAAYTAALTLTPVELDMVQAVRATFAELGDRAQAEGMLKTFRENYVPHLWDIGSKPRRGSGRTMRERMTHSMARTFETSFDGELLGFEPKTKKLSEVVPIYINEMNRVIADRKFARDLRRGTYTDGEPLVQVQGVGIPVDGPEGQATLIMPDVSKNKELKYKVLPDQPALHDWIWASKDSAGNPIYLKADMALHPRIIKDMARILGRSGIKEWYSGDTGGRTMAPVKWALKNIDRAQSEYKRSMLGFFATFHQVQEGWHGFGHRVSSFNRPKISLTENPVHMDYANHGLMIYPDRAAESEFMAGFKNSGIISRIPGVGQYADMYSNYLFHVFIPEMKVRTMEVAVARNMKVFKKELDSGETTKSAIKVLSAEQVNAAYGHLNYTNLGRSPTIQHILQLAFLAPDFLEARIRFAAQAAKGAAGAKVGREQALALGFLAVTQAVLAWLAAAIMGGDWDRRHPFEYRVGNRTYTMRSVPEDAMAMIDHAREFWFNRINPLVGRGLWMFWSGKDWRGENVTGTEIIQELAQGWLPLSVRPFVTETKSSLKPWEQFVGSAGFKISPYSSTAQMYKAAREWKKNSGDPKLVAEAKRDEKETHAVSDYTPLRRALENEDDAKAKIEYDKLLTTKNRLQVREAMSWNRPLSGSRKTERKFVESLSDDQKAIYAVALQTRKLIYERFLKMRAGKFMMEQMNAQPERKSGIADVPPIEP